MKRILIIGPNPIAHNSSTRALCTYFDAFDSANLKQLYSNTSRPPEPYCSEFYQVTDKDVLLRRGGRVYDGKTQNIFDPSKANPFFALLYRIGRKEWPIIQLLRRALWRPFIKKETKITQWAKEFEPDIIFLHNSNAFFLLELALKLADKTGANLFFEIADDYYFSPKFSRTLFGRIYTKKYRYLFEVVIKRAKGVSYISNRMKQKYDAYFGINGLAIPSCGQLRFEPREAFNVDNPRIVYVGNLLSGRNKTFAKLGECLEKNHSPYHIDIYCPKEQAERFKRLVLYPNLTFHPPVDYDGVKREIERSDILLSADELREKKAGAYAYSLSTKIGDYLYSGRPILAIGSTQCGTIDYLAKNRCAHLITKDKELVKFDRLVKECLCDKSMMDEAKECAARDFDKAKQTKMFLEAINEQ